MSELSHYEKQDIFMTILRFSLKDTSIARLTFITTIFIKF